jgi:hypothetical protein
MPVTIDLPKDVLRRAAVAASQAGISLEEFIVLAVEQCVMEPIRPRCLPAIGDELNGPRLGILAAEQIDQAMFG